MRFIIVGFINFVFEFNFKIVFAFSFQSLIRLRIKKITYFFLLFHSKFVFFKYNLNFFILKLFFFLIYKFLFFEVKYINNSFRKSKSIFFNMKKCHKYQWNSISIIFLYCLFIIKKFYFINSFQFYYLYYKILNFNIKHK